MVWSQIDLTLHDVTNTLDLLVSGYNARNFRRTARESPRATKIGHTASTAPEMHRTADADDQLDPAVGPAPDSDCSMPGTALLCSAWHKDAPTTTRRAGKRRPIHGGKTVLGMGGTEPLRSASSRVRMPARQPAADIYRWCVEAC